MTPSASPQSLTMVERLTSGTKVALTPSFLVGLSVRWRHRWCTNCLRCHQRCIDEHQLCGWFCCNQCNHNIRCWNDVEFLVCCQQQLGQLRLRFNDDNHRLQWRWPCRRSPRVASSKPLLVPISSTPQSHQLERVSSVSPGLFQPSADHSFRKQSVDHLRPLARGGFFMCWLQG